MLRSAKVNLAVGSSLNLMLLSGLCCASAISASAHLLEQRVAAAPVSTVARSLSEPIVATRKIGVLASKHVSAV